MITFKLRFDLPLNITEPEAWWVSVVELNVEIQDWQWTSNIILRHVRVTTVTVHVLCSCMPLSTTWKHYVSQRCIYGWFTYMAGNNRTYFGLPVKCSTFCAMFNKSIFSSDFHENPQHQTSWKSSCGSRDDACGQDGRTDRHHVANSRFTWLSERA